MLRRLRRLILQIIAGVAGIWLATEFIPEVAFNGPLRNLILAGLVLGLINFFIKPILNLVTLPLRMITFGLFSLVINIGIVWLMDVLFIELVIPPGLWPLFWTTIVVWFLSLLASKS